VGTFTSHKLKGVAEKEAWLATVTHATAVAVTAATAAACVC